MATKMKRHKSKSRAAAKKPARKVVKLASAKKPAKQPVAQALKGMIPKRVMGD